MIQSIQDEERSSLGFAVAALLNFIFMVFLNAHDAWRPWFDGVVTAAFDDVLWAVNLGFVLQIFGNLILSVTSPTPLRRLVEFIFAIGSLVAAVVFYRVFPLDLARFGDPVVVLARVVAFLGIAAASMTILVNFTRLFGAHAKLEGRVRAEGRRPHQGGTPAPLPPDLHSGA
jgi:hypothetical protein